jgi:hypothetical protein
MLDLRNVLSGEREVPIQLRSRDEEPAQVRQDDEVLGIAETARPLLAKSLIVALTLLGTFAACTTGDREGPRYVGRVVSVPDVGRCWLVYSRASSAAGRSPPGRPRAFEPSTTTRSAPRPRVGSAIVPQLLGQRLDGNDPLGPQPDDSFPTPRTGEGHKALLIADRS